MNISTVKKDSKIFFQGGIYVFLVSTNAYYISREAFLGVFIVSFLISYVWTFNVKKIAVSVKREQFIYSIGAACGATFGLLTSKIIFNFLSKLTW